MSILTCDNGVFFIILYVCSVFITHFQYLLNRPTYMFVSSTYYYFIKNKAMKMLDFIIPTYR